MDEFEDAPDPKEQKARYDNRHIDEMPGGDMITALKSNSQFTAQEELVAEEPGPSVTFNPPLFLQRQAWILDMLRRENVQSVLDIGCGTGPLLHALVQPPWSRPPPRGFYTLETARISSSGPEASAFPTETDTSEDIYLHTLHGLDPSLYEILCATNAIKPPADSLSDCDEDETYMEPFNGFERWRRRQARWNELEVFLWQGGFERMEKGMFMQGKDAKGEMVVPDAFVATEVIEHLPPDLLPAFAPTLLGRFRPRLLLLTTPNYNYNRRFSAPGKPSPTSYLDPTGRTGRTFRHSDHKFEWTPSEWHSYCTSAAREFGYNVDVAGVGRAVEPDLWHRDEELGFATQVAVFKRIDHSSDASSLPLKTMIPPELPLRLQAHYHHYPHPLSLEELSIPGDPKEILEVVKAAMQTSEVRTLALDDLWNEGEVSLKCKGDVGQLISAVESAQVSVKSWENNEPEWKLEKKGQGWKTEVTWLKFVPLPKDTPIMERHVSPALSFGDSGAIDEYKWLDEENEVQDRIPVQWDASGWGWGEGTDASRETWKAEEASVNTDWGWSDVHTNDVERSRGEEQGQEAT